MCTTPTPIFDVLELPQLEIDQILVYQTYELFATQKSFGWLILGQIHYYWIMTSCNHGSTLKLNKYKIALTIRIALLPKERATTKPHLTT
jgi:lysozyme family protein